MRRAAIAVLVLGGLLSTGFTAPTATSAVSSTDPVAVDPWLAATLTQAAPDDTIGVLAHGTSIDVVHTALANVGMAVTGDLHSIDVTIASGTPAQIALLRVQPGIVYVEGDQPLELMLDTANTATRAYEADRFTTPFGSPFDGSGVSIAVVDSGIDGTHPMFLREDGTSRVAANFKAVCIPIFGISGQDVPSNDQCMVPVPTNDSDTLSNGGHGTHVASIAAGGEVTTTEGETLRGAAPGATLIGLSSGQALSVAFASQGLQWVVDHHADPCGDGSCPAIKVVNNSYGPTGPTANYTYSKDSALSKLQTQLIEAGVVTVWAAGNDGGSGDVDFTNPTGDSPEGGVLSVANYNDAGIGANDGGLNDTSSRGLRTDLSTYPDLSAPGTDIMAACRPYLPVCSTGADGGDPNYDTISGTSMAAPFVAGVVARLFQADPSLTPAQVEAILLDTALPFGDADSYVADTRHGAGLTSYDKGHGLVDVTAALAAALGKDDVQPAPQCVPGYPEIVDQAGDALGLDPQNAEANEANVDLIGGRLATDEATGAIDVALEFTDLESFGTTSTGQWATLTFSYKGRNWIVEWFGDRTLDPLIAPYIELLDASESVVAELEGDVDFENDLLTAVIPADVFPGVPALTDGSVLSQFSAYVWHSMAGVGYGTFSDSGGGNCAFVVGSDITRPNEAPVPTFTVAPNDIRPGVEVTLDAAGTLDDTTPADQLSYEWDVDGDGLSDLTGATTTTTFDTPGVYDVALTVTDGEGASATTTRSVEVTANNAPTAIATASDQKVMEGDVVHFTGSASSDPDGDELTYAWDFGDGTTATGEVVQHAFATMGKYVVTVTVSDGFGGTSTDTIEIRVQRSR